MKLTLPVLLLSLPLLFGAFAVHADTLTLPPSKVHGTLPAHLPHRGMSMAAVRRDYGTPSKRYPTVGGHAPRRPPITRWDYPGFSVFFERSTVIDAVVPGHPPKLYHSKQLRSG